MVRMQVSTWAIGSLFAVLAIPTSTSADPISVTGGFLHITGNHGPLQLVGEHGFSLTSNVSASGGIFMPFVQCTGLVQCRPGAQVELGAEWSSSDLTGSVSFEGQTYPNLGNVNSATQATVRFSGSFVAPAASPSATLTAPFGFTGLFSIPDQTGTSVRHSLTGGGLATIHLGFEPNFNNWRVESVRYDFSDAAAPIPEPGTMLLVGLGTAAVARRVTRIRAKT